MRFADPQVCPDCRGAIAGQTRCPHCALDLTSPDVRQLWQMLVHADQLLARATRARDAAVLTPHVGGPAAGHPSTPADPPVAVEPPSPAPHPYPQHPPAPRPPTATAPPERPWSVGSILLSLGALALVVAGFIFVTQSWGDLRLVGRTLVLLGVTAAFGVLGVWVTRRPLRASAEAVWTVVLALLTLDFFAARHEGMLGLDGLDLAWGCVVWGVALLGLGGAVALLARKPVGADLVAPAVVAGIGTAMAGLGAANVPAGWALSWRSILALAVAGVLALATRPARLRPLTLVARVVVVTFFVWSYLVAVFELVDHPAVGEVVGDGRGLPVAVMALASVVVAWAVRELRVVAVALAVIAVCVLVTTPVANESQPEGVWSALAVLAAILAVAGRRGTGDWMRGVRAGTVPAVVAVLVLLVVLSAEVVGALGDSLDAAWTVPADARLEAELSGGTVVWVVPVVLVCALVVAWAVPHWPELGVLRTHTWSIVTVIAGVAATEAVVALRLPLWAAVTVLALLAAGFLWARLRAAAVLAGPMSAALVLVASTLAVAHPGVSAGTWLAGAVVLAGLALANGPLALRAGCAAAAVGLFVAGLASALDLLDPPDAVPPLAALLASLALVGAAGLLLRDHPVRQAVEATGAVAAVVALVVGGSTGELAVRWTVAGVVAIALGFVLADRRWYLWPGAAALVVAYVLLVLDSGFSFVEAYTLPLGAIALVVGLHLVRRPPGTSTWLLLGPGLALCLLPSVPQALADPAGLRALLVGIGAVLALALGARLGWQAPFVLGVVLLTLLVLVNLGPYASAAPRVVLIAGVGVLLLGFGITWEDRVRDGRRLVGYVRSMR